MNHPKQLWTGSHHWHFVGATEHALTLHCCSCGYSIMVEVLEDSFLRYSMMCESTIVGIGRGLLLGDCPAGQRQIEIDGFEEGCSRANWAGLEEVGLLRLPAMA